MTFSNLPPTRRAALRDDAVRLRAILRGVRGARSDERDFALFDARDELKGLGVDATQIDSFDPRDDAALDHHIGQAHAVATALGAPDEADHSALFGDGGQDTLAGGGGEDVVFGGPGDDTISLTASRWPASAVQVIGDAVNRSVNIIADPLRTAERLGQEERARALERAGLAGEKTAHNNRYDAERHARWNYRMAQELGPVWATAIGTGYELKEFAPLRNLGETLMDLHNNGGGVGQAQAGGNPPTYNTPGIVTMERRGSRYPTGLK